MHHRLQFGADRLKAKQAQQTAFVVYTGQPAVPLPPALFELVSCGGNSWRRELCCPGQGLFSSTLPT